MYVFFGHNDCVLESDSGDDSITLILKSLNYTLENALSGEFYIMSILSQ